MSFVFCAVLMQSTFMAAELTEIVNPDIAALQTPIAAVATETTKKSESKDDESYSEAHRQTLKTGKPLVVMVGADWCGPCQNMRRTILPRVREHGFFRKIAFAHVNVDRERELATQITGGGAVPQLVMFRKTRKGWTQRKMIGAHSVEEVESFINEGLAKDNEERNSEVQASKETPTSQSTTSADQADEKQHG